MKPVAFITGGTRGIGLGIARELASQGFDLAVNGIRPESDIDNVKQELQELGAEVIYCQGSIADAEARKSMIYSIRQRFHRLNWLVNNAGVAPAQRLDLLDTTPESFDHVVGTNLTGTFFLSQLAARWLVEQKQEDNRFQGGIINISSISATVVSINRGEYCVAKAGLSMTTQLFAARLGELDLPVFEVRPGVIRTDMTSGVTDKYDRLIKDGLCVTRRWGLPEDVGRVVGALTSGAFPYSTGQVVMVDGGLTMPRL